MMIAIPSCIKLEKKEKDEGIGEKSDSLINEEKHDKSEDRKVEVEKTSDPLTSVTGASGEDKEGDAALAQEQKTDDSPSLEAFVDEKELISKSPDVPITETPSGDPQTQSQEPLPTVATGEQIQPQAVKETTNLEVQEKSQEPERGRVDQPDINATTESSVETIQATREPESNAIPDTANSEAGPPENPTEIETRSGEEGQPNTVIPATSVESAEKPGNMIEVQPPRESDIESLEAVPASADGEKKPVENLQVAEELKKLSEDEETEQQPVGEPAKSEGTSDDTKDHALISKQEEETSVSPQVSPHKEALVANEVESSPGITQNVVREDGKKEPSGKAVIEGMSKGSVGVSENPERDFVNQEAKTDLQEQKEDSAAPSVDKKLAANDDKKSREARDAVEGLSREADTIAITEEEGDKLESVRDDQRAEEEHAEMKVDEITGAISEPVRETLASKFEEKEEEESITSGVDKVEKETAEEPVKTDSPTKETAAKPPQKQSNKILHKVKQSLLKAKKAITGKSSTAKSISSETKGDIQVK